MQRIDSAIPVGSQRARRNVTGVILDILRIGRVVKGYEVGSYVENVSRMAKDERAVDVHDRLVCWSTLGFSAGKIAVENREHHVTIASERFDRLRDISLNASRVRKIVPAHPDHRNVVPMGGVSQHSSQNLCRRFAGNSFVGYDPIRNQRFKLAGIRLGATERLAVRE